MSCDAPITRPPCVQIRESAGEASAPYALEQLHVTAETDQFRGPDGRGTRGNPGTRPLAGDGGSGSVAERRQQLDRKPCPEGQDFSFLSRSA